MQVVERNALVTHTAAQMFALVNDVARYPEFLPWCVAARVEDVAGGERIAALKVARGVLQTEFTTRNTLRQDSQIHMQLMHGPFRQLTGEWRFDAIGYSRFARQFPGRVRVQKPPDRGRLQRACSKRCAARIVDAFVLRARTIYPPGN